MLNCGCFVNNDSIIANFNKIGDKKGPIQIKCPNKECYYSLTDQELIKIMGDKLYGDYITKYRVISKSFNL